MPLTKPPQRVADRPRRSQALHLTGGQHRRQPRALRDKVPRKTRFGSPLIMSRVHWVELKHVAEITYLTWTADNLLRQTVYVGLREDNPAEQVRHEG
jgi:ATP-dependent DNA ligase